MAKINKEKLAKYRELAKRDLWEFQEPKASAIFQRMEQEGCSLNDYADLRPLKIAVALGAAAEPRFDNDTSLNKITVPDYKNGAEIFLAPLPSTRRS